MEITFNLFFKKALEGRSLCPVGSDFPEGLGTIQSFFLGSWIDEQLGGEQGENSLSYSTASAIIKSSCGWSRGSGGWWLDTGKERPLREKPFHLLPGG